MDDYEVDVFDGFGEGVFNETGFNGEEWKDMIDEIMLEEYDTTKEMAARWENRPGRWHLYIERVASTALMRLDCQNAAPLAQIRLDQCMREYDQERGALRSQGVKRNWLYLEKVKDNLATLVAIGASLAFIFYPGNILASPFFDWVAACCGLPIIYWVSSLSLHFFVALFFDGSYGVDGYWDLKKEYKEIFQVYEEKTIFGFERVSFSEGDVEVPSQWTWVTCDWDGCEHRLPKWEGLKINRDGNRCTICEKMCCGYHFHPRMRSCISCSGVDLRVDDRVKGGLPWVPDILDWIDVEGGLPEPTHVQHNVDFSENPVEEEMRKRGLL